MERSRRFRRRRAHPRTLSLSLIFGFTAIGILILSTVAVSYLYERIGSSGEQANRRDYLRLHAERAADQLHNQVERLIDDTLFLARTPPLQNLRSMPEPATRSAESETFFEPLKALFLSLAYARPWYFQLRLIGPENNARELVRIERQGTKVAAIPSSALQSKGHRYYVREAVDLAEGEVKLSHIDLNREHGEISLPTTATLRAVTPIRDQSGQLIALVVINLDMKPVFDSMSKLVPISNRLYLADQEGSFLYHPDPDKALDLDRAHPYGLEQEFPAASTEIKRIEPGSGEYFETGTADTSLLAYALRRPLDNRSPDPRQITLVLVDAPSGWRRQIAAAWQNSYLAVTTLVGVAALLLALLAHRLTRSLRNLVRASKEVTQGDYTVVLPHSSIGEIDQLNRSFEHMIASLQDREVRLQELNRTLEDRVSQRTNELEASQTALVRKHSLLQTVVDHIADGVVAVDSAGRFLLWNKRAETIVGFGPAELPTRDWPQHYGVYHSPAGEPFPTEELPLVRALAGETVRGQELFVRNAMNMPGHWISVDARPVLDAAGKPDGAVAVMTNRDEARRLREIREARSGELSRIVRLALIGQIVDTTVHRLSQPLAAIANYAAAAALMLASNSLGSEQLNEILGHIKSQTERSGKTLDMLRTLTRSGGLKTENVDLNGVILSALELLSDRLQHQNIRVERQLEPELPEVHGQEMELQQAVIHLVINAMESLSNIAEGRRYLRVFTKYCADENRIHVVIEHTIPIAEKPSNGHTPSRPLTSPTDTPGLGLAVVRNILEQHNGNVGVKYEDQGLVRYLIDLPVKRTING